MPTVRFFPFRFAPAYSWAGLPFGVTSASTGLTVDDTVLRIRFGPWYLRAPLTNLVGTTITGPYARLKTIGPAHLSFADRGLTFATNNERGLCIQFATPVPGIDPFGLIRHPGVTVTVADCEGLAELLDQRRPRSDLPQQEEGGR